MPKVTEKFVTGFLQKAENINLARKWAAKHNKTLRADKDFDHTVVIVHEDGSAFTYQFAFMLNLWDNFIVVFHEHSAPAVFFKADLSRYGQYKTMRVDYVPLSSLKNVK